MTRIQGATGGLYQKHREPAPGHNLVPTLCVGAAFLHALRAGAGGDDCDVKCRAVVSPRRAWERGRRAVPSERTLRRSRSRADPPGPPLVRGQRLWASRRGAWRELRGWHWLGWCRATNFAPIGRISANREAARRERSRQMAGAAALVGEGGGRVQTLRSARFERKPQQAILVLETQFVNQEFHPHLHGYPRQTLGRFRDTGEAGDALVASVCFLPIWAETQVQGCLAEFPKSAVLLAVR